MPTGSDAGLLVFLVLAAVGIAWAVVYFVRYFATGDVVQADKAARKAAGNLVGLLSVVLPWATGRIRGSSCPHTRVSCSPRPVPRLHWCRSQAGRRDGGRRSAASWEVQHVVPR